MSQGDSSPSGGLGDLVSKLQAAQADLEAETAAIEAAVVEGSAAGGAVVVRLRGSLEAESVHIDSSIVDPSDPALLEDAVLAALRDALGRIVELRSPLQEQVAPPFGGGIDINAIAGNLGLETMFGGLDVNSLMASFGLAGVDLGAFGVHGELDDGDWDDDLDDEPEA